ncbi:hypothetical protein [Sphingomonas adhaesiva]|uniref:hypothetical protein n=1 Tax=Sphingomonas adhaesiva TaxID=28212 RepID=UPI002FFCE900
MRRGWAWALALALAPALAGWAVPAAAQRLGGGAAAVDLSPGRILAALLVCVAAAFALAVLLRARGADRSPMWKRVGERWRAPSRVRVIETRRAGVHADVCLVECDGEQYLLICGPSAQTVLRAPERSRVA